MNLSSLIPAMVGGMIAMIPMGSVRHDHPTNSHYGAVDAVAHIYRPSDSRVFFAGERPGGWAETESILDQSADDFRKNSSQEIETIALALQGMTRRVDQGALSSRSYLRTRLQALREHVDYARAELIKLPSSQGDENFLPSHAHFYRTLTCLERAVSQVASEMSGDL